MYDTDGEAKHGMKLKETLERARFQRGKLFMGHTFHLTSGVPNYGTVKSVITTHGGKVSSDLPHCFQGLGILLTLLSLSTNK